MTNKIYKILIFFLILGIFVILMPSYSLAATNLSSTSITLSKTSYTYTSQEQRPSVTVKYKSKTLKLDKDYGILYLNNKNVGTAKVIITGKGGYTGTITKTFNITPCPIKNLTITLDKTSYEYRGGRSDIRPGVRVYQASRGTLQQGKDFTVSYSNNINVGAGRVTITGKGNYTGSITKSFTITKASIANIGDREFYLSCALPAEYTGKLIKPKVNLFKNSIELKENTDYTVRYSNNQNVGTAIIQITGKGNYTGILTKTFEIKYDIKNSISVRLNTNKTEVILTNIYNNQSLTKGIDYTIKYSYDKNNKIGGATISGKGKYFGCFYRCF